MCSSDSSRTSTPCATSFLACGRCDQPRLAGDGTARADADRQRRGVPPEGGATEASGPGTNASRKHAQESSVRKNRLSQADIVDGQEAVDGENRVRSPDRTTSAVDGALEDRATERRRSWRSRAELTRQARRRRCAAAPRGHGGEHHLGSLVPGHAPATRRTGHRRRCRSSLRRSHRRSNPPLPPSFLLTPRSATASRAQRGRDREVDRAAAPGQRACDSRLRTRRDPTTRAPRRVKVDQRGMNFTQTGVGTENLCPVASSSPDCGLIRKTTTSLDP